MNRAAKVSRTTAPADGRPVVLFDGHCDFCRLQASRLARYARGRVVLVSFQDEGALNNYPGVTHEECMKEMKLIDRRGRVFGGAEAVVRSIDAGHPVLGKVLFLYYLPGVRWIADRTYAWVARNRYRLLAADPDACRTGHCRRHES